jgi:hypothetical protein
MFGGSDTHSEADMFGGSPSPDIATGTDRDSAALGGSATGGGACVSPSTHSRKWQIWSALAGDGTEEAIPETSTARPIAKTRRIVPYLPVFAPFAGAGLLYCET